MVACFLLAANLPIMIAVVGIFAAMCICFVA